MSNGRGDLVHVKNLSPGKNDAQLRRIMTRLLGKARGGIIRPECTNKHCKKKAPGGPGFHSKEEHVKKSKKHNPINNPIHAQKRKAANDAKSRATIVAQGLGHIMRSEADTKLLREPLLSIKTYATLGNMTMSQAIARNSFAIYIGTTARALEEEDLRFLTAS
jgi:hypothetical protein